MSRVNRSVHFLCPLRFTVKGDLEIKALNIDLEALTISKKNLAKTIYLRLHYTLIFVPLFLVVCGATVFSLYKEFT